MNEIETSLMCFAFEGIMWPDVEISSAPLYSFSENENRHNQCSWALIAMKMWPRLLVVPVSLQPQYWVYICVSMHFNVFMSCRGSPVTVAPIHNQRYLSPLHRHCPLPPRLEGRHYNPWTPTLLLLHHPPPPPRLRDQSTPNPSKSDMWIKWSDYTWCDHVISIWTGWADIPFWKCHDSHAGSLMDICVWGRYTNLAHCAL